MVRSFDIAQVNKSASAFDVEKLTWLNQQHMMRASPGRIVPVLRSQLERLGISAGDADRLEQIVLVQRERTKIVREMAVNSAFFFRPPAAYDEKAVRKHVTFDILPLIDAVRGELAALGEWSAAAIHELISALAAAHQVTLGKLAQPIRLAVCGGTVSPPIDATLAILGKTESLSRLAAALALWTAKHADGDS